jgi:hypothetical protein
MNFKQWLENIYGFSQDDLKNTNIDLPSPQQFQFDRYMLKEKFGSLVQKYPNANLDYEEKEDVLTVYMPLIEEFLYLGDGDKEKVFPAQLVQKAINQHFVQHRVGLLFPGTHPSLPNTPAVIAGEVHPLTPYLFQAETGYYELAIDFPNASKMPLSDLDTRIGRFVATAEKVAADLESMQNRFYSNQ